MVESYSSSSTSAFFVINVEYVCWLSNSFCPESISNEFGTTKSREVYLNGNTYDFSDDCSYIDKSD